MNEIDSQNDQVKIQLVDAYVKSLTGVFAVHHSREFQLFLDADRELAKCFDAEMSHRDR